MSEQDRNLKQIKENSIKERNQFDPELELLIKSTAKIFLLLTVVLILICFVLLLQGYLTNHIAYEKLIFETLNIKLGIHEFYSFCFKIIGYLFLITTILIFSLFEKNKNTYYSFSMAILFLLFSFIELVYITKFNLNYQQYIYIILLHIFSLSIVFIKYFLLQEKLANIIGIIAILTITLSSLIK